MKTHIKNLLLSLAALTLINAAFGQSPATKTTSASVTDTIPMAPDVKVGKLANGLTYYIKKNNLPEKKVELRLVVKAGSMLEDDDQQGLAHFTEHMSFNGSAHFKKNDLVSFLQSIGVKFGADLNAYTGFEETVYILPIPLEKPENFEKGMEVLEDWASAVTFDNNEIDKERGVVLEESRLGKGAQDRMNKVIYPKLFEGTPYAGRLPIGKDEILKSFKYDAIKRFYHDWYRPDLMAVLVVGDIDPAVAEKMIKAHFAKLKNPPNERRRIVTVATARTKSEAVIVSDKEATRSILSVYYSPTKADDQATAGYFRNYILRSLCFGMLATRFGEATQKANPPFLFGTVQAGEFVKGYDVVTALALLGAEGPEPAIKAIGQETERARKFGFSEAELARTKAGMMKNMESYYNERDKTESETAIEELIRNFVDKEPVPGVVREYGYYQQFVPEITLAEVNAYAAKTIPSTGNKLIVLSAPEQPGFKIPTTDELIGYVDAASKSEVTAYEEKAVAKNLMTTTPAAGKIVAEKENKELGFTELTLSNGIRVIVKSTDFKNDEILMTGFRYGGSSLYSNEDRYNAEYASAIVPQMGVGTFSPVDLRKVLAGKDAQAGPRITGISEGISGQSSVKDIETMFQLTWLYFNEPRQDDDLFNSFITKQKAAIQNMFSEPQAVFRDTLLKVMYNGNPRGPRLPRLETFSKISEQRALAIYKERFGDAAGFTFIFVGKIDLTTLRPLLSTYLASLHATTKKPAFRDLGVRPAAGIVKLDVHKGSAPKSLISMTWSGEAKYSDQEDLRVDALVETINIKLIEKLREELSGIYGGGMSGSLNKLPYENYSLSVQLPCGPENVDKLITATQAEIEKVRKSGPTQEDLNKVKENWKKQYDENIKTNHFWLSNLQQVQEATTTATDVIDYKKRVDALTVGDIKEAANKYLSGKNYFQAVLYPEK